MWVATTDASCLRGDGEVVGIAEPADVVADDRAGLARGVEHARPPRVARDRRRRSARGAPRSAGRPGRAPRPRSPRARARPSRRRRRAGRRPRSTSTSARRSEVVELERRAPVVERVGRAVEDAHHERAGREVVHRVTEAVPPPASRRGGTSRGRSTAASAATEHGDMRRSLTITPRPSTRAPEHAARDVGDRDRSRGSEPRPSGAAAQARRAAARDTGAEHAADDAGREPADRERRRRAARRARFAGSATSGIDPNTGISTGATPICAAAVTAERSRAATAGRGAARRSAAPSTAMPTLAPHDEQEPDRVQEERVDEQQHGGRERQHAQPDGGPAEDTAPSEPRTPPSRTRAAPTAPTASSCRTARAPRAPRRAGRRSGNRRSSGANEREDERDVLARHREEVREARGAELLGDGRSGSPHGVAEEEAREERPVDRARAARRRRARAPRDRVGRRGRSGRRRRRSTATSSVACERADRVLPAHPRVEPGRAARASPRSRDAVARFEHPDRRRRRRRPTPRSRPRRPPASRHAARAARELHVTTHERLACPPTVARGRRRARRARSTVAARRDQRRERRVRRARRGHAASPRCRAAPQETTRDPIRQRAASPRPRRPARRPPMATQRRAPAPGAAASPEHDPDDDGRRAIPSGAERCALASHRDQRRELGEALVADAAHLAELVDRLEPAARLVARR